MKENKEKVQGYIPDNAQINIGSNPLPPPPTQYEKRKKILSREEVNKKVTKIDE